MAQPRSRTPARCRGWVAPRDLREQPRLIHPAASTGPQVLLAALLFRQQRLSPRRTGCQYSRQSNLTGSVAVGPRSATLTSTPLRPMAAVMAVRAAARAAAAQIPAVRVPAAPIPAAPAARVSAAARPAAARARASALRVAAQAV